MGNSSNYHLTNLQKWFLVLLRLSIGWHFLREGTMKLAHQPVWTPKFFMLASWGPFADLFHWMANTEWTLAMSDFIMPWALTFVGLGLIFGVFTRTATLVGMGLLAMFYFATPPWPVQMVTEPVTNFAAFQSWVHNAEWAGNQSLGGEGNYMIVNKNFIEFMALAALLTVNTSEFCGIDPLIRQYFGKLIGKKDEATATMQPAEQN